MDIIKAIEQEQLKKDVPDFSIGDYVRVNVKVKEGNRERIQAFEGTVIAKKGSGISETFTVRKYPTELEWKEFSLFIHQELLVLKLSEKVKSEERSFIICVRELVNQQKLNKIGVNS